MITLSQIPYLPQFPKDYRPMIGIVGVGDIVRDQHLTAYKKYGVQVAGIYDINPESIALAQKSHDVGTVYPSLEALLADERIEVVDVATHPRERPAIVRQALAAGKHVLSQKPVALDAVTAQSLIDEAKARGLKLAVNQNGRWTPPWRIATLLIESGAIGEVFAVTHQFDTHFSWLVGRVFDNIKHWLFYDYGIHWFDITRCWMGDREIDSIRAREYRVPGQVAEGKAMWGGWAEIAYADGANAMIRSIGASKAVRHGHNFWAHGSEGLIRGSVLINEYVVLERDGGITEYQPEGGWFPDAFAGTMAELLSAIAEDREPFNSAAHNLLSLQMTLAACRSAELDAAPLQPVGLDYAFD